MINPLRNKIIQYSIDKYFDIVCFEINFKIFWTNLKMIR